MTIEQKLNTLINGSIEPSSFWYEDVKDWKYHAQRDEDGELQITKFESYCFSHFLHKEAIDKLIREVDEAECLTSPSEFIREYRKWAKEIKKSYKSRYIDQKVDMIIKHALKDRNEEDN